MNARVNLHLVDRGILEIENDLYEERQRRTVKGSMENQNMTGSPNYSSELVMLPMDVRSYGRQFFHGQD